MIDPRLSRRVEMTGWSTVLLGALCLVLAGFEAAMPSVLHALGSAIAAGDDPLLRSTRAAFVEGAAASATINVVFGVGLAVVGVAVVRRASWAHAAMTWAAWLSIVAVVLLAKPGVAPLLAMAGSSSRALPLVLAALLLSLQVVAVLVFLRFWRKAPVRALFD